MSRRFVFVAPAQGGWGEVSLGLRIARELIEGGHQVTFAAPRSLHLPLRASGIEVVSLNARRESGARFIPGLMRRSRAGVLVLVDAATWSWWAGRRTASLRRLDAPIIALDVWGIGEPGFRWDFGDSGPVSPVRVPAGLRLRPVPFLRPARGNGSYNALPVVAPTGHRARQRSRDRLGVGSRERVILLTSARWQAMPVSGPKARRLAHLLPWLIAALMGRLDERVRLVHVGPAPFAPIRLALGRRYHWMPQLAPGEFESVLRACDLMLSFNAAGTASTLAIALGIPVLTGINSHAFRSLGQAFDSLGPDPSPLLQAWLRKVVPLPRFAVWPVGFHQVMARALSRNPYCDLINPTEVLDEAGFLARCRTLLYDRTVRGRFEEAREAYCRRVAGCPRAAELIASFLV